MKPQSIHMELLSEYDVKLNRISWAITKVYDEEDIREISELERTQFLTVFNYAGDGYFLDEMIAYLPDGAVRGQRLQTFEEYHGIVTVWDTPDNIQRAYEKWLLEYLKEVHPEILTKEQKAAAATTAENGVDTLGPIERRMVDLANSTDFVRDLDEAIAAVDN